MSKLINQERLKILSLERQNEILLLSEKQLKESYNQLLIKSEALKSDLRITREMVGYLFTLSNGKYSFIHTERK